MDKPKKISRRAWLKGCAYVTGAGALSVLGGRFALADGSAAKKAAKSAVQYQNSPKDGKMCGMCKFFIRSGGMMSEGSCQVVEGAVSPMGYCILFTQA